MHNLTPFVRVLRLSGIFLGVLYVGLLSLTVFHASLRVELSDAYAAANAEVGVLEARFQARLASFAKLDPSLMGYTQPLTKRFAETPPGLSRAR